MVSRYENAVELLTASADTEPGPIDLVDEDAPLHVFITTATWCDSCKRHLPRIAALKESLADTKVVILGVPADEKDTVQKWKKYQEEFKPAYRIATGIEPQQRERMLDLIKQKTGTDALPCTLVVDRTGYPVAVEPGIPSVSKVRKLVSESN